MAFDIEKPLKLNLDILPEKARKAFVFLSGQKWLSRSGWYLAGGSGLALLAGHRLSVDLDFFSSQKEINNVEILTAFSSLKQWKTVLNKENTIYGELFGAKISFIAYPFFIFKKKPVIYGSIRILQPFDIAIMKIIAISQRGKKRDFYDLYWCAKNIAPLNKLVRQLKTQYPSVAHDYHHILKSLVYFKDAENDPEPKIRFQANWKEVKKFFSKEIPLIASEIIGLNN